MCMLPSTQSSFPTCSILKLFILPWALHQLLLFPNGHLCSSHSKVAQMDTCEDSHCTCLDYPAIVHQQQSIGLFQKFCPMGAKDSGLVLENSKNALLHQMTGYICIDCSQGIIKEVKLFFLRKRQKTRTSSWPCLNRRYWREVPQRGTLPAAFGQHEVVQGTQPEHTVQLHASNFTINLAQGTAELLCYLPDKQPWQGLFEPSDPR